MSTLESATSLKRASSDLFSYCYCYTRARHVSRFELELCCIKSVWSHENSTLTYWMPVIPMTAACYINWSSYIYIVFKKLRWSCRKGFRTPILAGYTTYWYKWISVWLHEFWLCWWHRMHSIFRYLFFQLNAILTVFTSGKMSKQTNTI